MAVCIITFRAYFTSAYDSVLFFATILATLQKHCLFKYIEYIAGKINILGEQKCNIFLISSQNIHC